MITATLPERMRMRAVQDEAGVQEFVRFNATWNNSFEGATCECLLRHHPKIRHEDFWMVEDEQKNEVVASTCLIPWDCFLAGVPLRLAMLEMVLTHPDYRGRGLVRAQVEIFHQRVKERSFDLCVISGIPFFYRQFGYAYTLGNTAEILSTWHIPGNNPKSFLIRPVENRDNPGLVKLYYQECAHLESFIARDGDDWNYLVGPAKHLTWVLEDAADRQMAGYLVLQQTSSSLEILEYAFYTAEAAKFALSWLKQRGAPELVIHGPRNGSLSRLARGLGSQTLRQGEWLVRIPDVAAFLSRLAPVFERRLAGSIWKNLTGDLTFNLFRQAFCMKFQQGQLLSVVSLGFVDSSMGAEGGDLCIPPDAFVRLVTGYRELEDLFDAWPDIVVKNSVRPLIDQLFPRLEGYWTMPYHYLG